MKALKLRKNLLATTVGAVLALGMASQAYASPVFTVTPTGPIGLIAPFDADFINGSSSELLIGSAPLGAAAGTLTAASGWLNFTGFSNAGNPVLPFTSGLGVDYQLYLTFSLSATYTGGGTGFGTAGSNYSLNSLLFSLYLSPLSGGLNTFIQANAATNTAATVSGMGNDTLLGSGSLVAGVAGFDAQFGAFLNSTTSYANTVDGSAFFTAPDPFYNVAFNAFNNTTQGVIVNNSTNGCTLAAPCLSVTNAIGGVDFNRVPEPATLGLLGLGLLGMGASLRKRKAA